MTAEWGICSLYKGMNKFSNLSTIFSDLFSKKGGGVRLSNSDHIRKRWCTLPSDNRQQKIVGNFQKFLNFVVDKFPFDVKIIRGILLTLVLLTAACSQKRDGEPPGPISPPEINATLSEIVGMCRDYCYMIDIPIVAEGVVSANDKDGNISNSLFIESDGVAVQIRVWHSELHSRYPAGCRVAICAEGLALGRYMGCVELGFANFAGGEYKCDYIYSEQLLDQTLYRLSESIQKPTPALMKISQIGERDYGRLITIENLSHVADDEDSSLNPTIEGYHLFTDPDGESITTYVSPYADFAHKPIPDKPVAIKGILQYSESKGLIIRVIL